MPYLRWGDMGKLFSSSFKSVATSSIFLRLRGFLSIDIDISDLQVNQCNNPNKLEIMSYNQHLRQYYPFVRNSKPTEEEQYSQIEAFHGSHKCHVHSMRCVYRPVTMNVATAVNLNYNHYSNTSSYTNGSSGAGPAIISKNLRVISGWKRGAYECKCKDGFYSGPHPQGFNGSIMEVAYQEYRENISSFFMDSFVCLRCAPGCATCTGPDPCLASYNWVFRFVEIWYFSCRVVCIFAHCIPLSFKTYRK